jgi:hypothetical protein
LTYANIFKKIFKKQSEGSAAYEIQNSQFKILSPKGHDYLTGSNFHNSELIRKKTKNIFATKATR